MYSRPGPSLTPIKARTDYHTWGAWETSSDHWKDGSPPREGVLGWGGNEFLGCERKEPLEENPSVSFPPAFIADVMADCRGIWGHEVTRMGEVGRGSGMLRALEEF